MEVLINKFLLNYYQYVNAFQWFFLFFFLVVNVGYMVLNLFSIFSVFSYMKREAFARLRKRGSRFEPPVSVLVPAFNEDKTISTTVRSILQLEYPEFEVIVINDGSRDKTLETLLADFDMAPLPQTSRRRLETKPVKAIYRSTIYPNLRVIDKENGGKSDALNVGINASVYPLFCSVDADSLLQQDSLTKVVQPFIEDPYVVACGGTIRAANGCTVKNGYLIDSNLPLNPLANLQIVEYMRAFLVGRLGWAQLNSLLVISGAFGVYKKEPVIEVGGYSTKTVGEDMELTLRLHKKYLKEGRKYKITFIPDPICWTEVPEDLATLKKQRMRWQQGLGESLFMHRDLLFYYRGKGISWFAMPFMILFELLGSVIEVAGYFTLFVVFYLGVISKLAFFTFLFVSVGLGVFLSVSSLLIEEISFHVYRKPQNIFILILYAIVENFGYRQLNAWWRAVGLVKLVIGKKGSWGDMKRHAKWKKDDKPAPLQVAKISTQAISKKR